MPIRLSVILAAVMALAACSKGPEASQKGAASQPLILAAEDLHTIRNSALTSGPAITGSVQPERRADLRAEIPAIVLQVLKENGDAIHRGDLLVRMDDTAIRDGLASAEATNRAAAQAFDQAGRQLERMKTLRASGMTSAQAMEDAEIRRNTTQSELEAAKARVVLARQQLQRTEVRAPFDGIVSDRKVSADQVGQVKPGQMVHFRVNGYGDQEFAGKVRRVNPAANPTTRQVEVLVDFVGEKQPKLAGLYAEGRVATESKSSLTIPASAVIRDGDKTSAWRVRNNKLQKVALAVAERDARSGDYVITGGLAEGDQVIRYPTTALKEGQSVQASAPAKSSMASTEQKPGAAR